ncbi:MAG: DNA integrity scanning protein DisA nucleotide-binding domain protein [Deltaproteobacteria bacterium]|nr:DNA integrity scanning protein DisA nucleotide-binding domain protein [Deltaproteobacteria bacterium]
MNAYPKDIIPALKNVCTKLEKRKYGKPPTLPPDEELHVLLDTAFHASFLTEEGRRTGFRILYVSFETMIKEIDKHSDNRWRIINFDTPRPYSVSELNRLAPAAELTHLMICVSNSSQNNRKSSLEIWGLLDVGENWWKFVHNETHSGMSPPNYFAITSMNAGELSISAAGDVLTTLKGGKLVYPKDTAIWDGSICDFLQTARNKLYQSVITALGTKSWDEEGQDDDYPYRFYNFFIERILFYVREKSHGGTLIIVPDYVSKDDTRLTDRLNLKYPCSYDYAWEMMTSCLVNERKYFDLHFPLWDAKLEITQNNFQEYHMLSSKRDDLDEAIGDAARAIASMTSVDGAVVLTDKLKVLGFGAEVLAISPSLKEVKIEVRSKTIQRIPIESFGTRHRSAFRFCSSFEEAVIFVVSQDGGVKAIKRVCKEVVLWPDINTGAMGL